MTKQGRIGPTLTAGTREQVAASEIGADRLQALAW